MRLPFLQISFTHLLASENSFPPPTIIVVREMSFKDLKSDHWSDIWEEAPVSLIQVEGVALLISALEICACSHSSDSSPLELSFWLDSDRSPASCALFFPLWPILFKWSEGPDFLFEEIKFDKFLDFLYFLSFFWMKSFTAFLATSIDGHALIKCFLLQT